MALNRVVIAQLSKILADSNLRLERLLAKERAMPNVISNHSARLSVGKQIREARDQMESWWWLMSRVPDGSSEELGVDERSVPGA